MSPTCAPIALFTFNRPDHLAKTLAALSQNQLASESRIIAFSDGPRSVADQEAIDACRAMLSEAKGFAQIELRCAEQNQGLAKSIIAGVSQVVETHGRVIVMEDDLVTHPLFLRYMNHHLDELEHEERVVSIHGYLKPITYRSAGPTFLRGADCWGWATWKSAWEVFEADGAKLLKSFEEQPELIERFNMDGSYPYLRMLGEQVAGEIDSWAIRWLSSAFLANKLTLYPPVSLVQNIGMDGSGTHGDRSTKHNSTFAAIDGDELFLKPDIKENEVLRSHIVKWNKAHAPTFWEKVRYNLRTRILGKR